MKIGLEKLPLPQKSVLELFRGGLRELQGRITFTRNPKARLAGKQPDAELKDYLRRLTLVNGKPKLTDKTSSVLWSVTGNFSNEYNRDLHNAFIEGRGDIFLKKNPPRYKKNRITSEMRATRTARDLFRSKFDVLKLGKEILISLKKENSKERDDTYRKVLKAAGLLQKLVKLLRSGDTSPESYVAIRKKMIKYEVSPVGWDFSRFIRSVQAELAALESAPTQKSRKTVIKRLNAFLFDIDFKNLNNRKANKVKAAIVLDKLLPAKSGDLYKEVKALLDNPSWAGDFEGIIRSARKVPLYVLNEYRASTYNFAVMKNMGTPAVAQDLWNLFPEECDESVGACFPERGHYHLKYEHEARQALENFRAKVLTKIKWTPVLKKHYLKEVRNYLKGAQLNTLLRHLKRVPTNATGLHLAEVFRAITKTFAVDDAQKELIFSRLVLRLFRVARQSNISYLPPETRKPTVRASEAQKYLVEQLRRYDMPLRKSGEPVSKGWAVLITENVSVNAAVSSESRKLLLKKLPGDPPLYSREAVIYSLGLHEVFHAMRAESARSARYALLSMGVLNLIDFEEGLATFLERLALPALLTERKVIAASTYFSISMALKNRAPDFIKPLYSWQDIYDTISSFGLEEDTVYERIRRQMRATDGQRRPLNVNARDATYFRGIQKIREWIPTAFGKAIIEHLRHDEFMSGRLRGEKERDVLTKEIREMFKDKKFQQHYATAAILQVLNKMMVGKVTPEFIEKMESYGHYTEPMYLIKTKPINPVPKSVRR